MFIPNNPLAELAMQDIISANSVKAPKPFFNTSFDIESMANFYTMSSSFSLACHYSKEHENSSIEDNISQPPDDLPSGQNWEVLKHVRSRKLHWMLDNVVTSIRQTIKEKVGIMPRPWQISAMINSIYNKKNVVISASKGSDKSLPYQLISLIKDGAMVLVVLPTIILITDQMCFYLVLGILDTNYFNVSHC